MTTAELLPLPGTGVVVDRTHNNYILNIKNQTVAQGIKSAIPFVRSQPYANGELLMLPVCDDTIKVLDNLGLPTNGMEPLRWQYKPPMIEGKYKPMAHQITSAAYMSVRKRCYNFSTMRTGKTGAVILCTDYLQSIKGVSGAVLVVATVSNLTGVWAHTIKTTLPSRRVVVVHSDKGLADRKAKLEIPADYYVTNYDGVKLLKNDLYQMLKDGRISIIVIDELTHYGNATSQRFKDMDTLVNARYPQEKYIYGLTGSPGSNPEPVYGFAKMVNPARLPCRKFTGWRDLTMYKYNNERAWGYGIKRGAKDLIRQTLSPAIRFDKKDIMDLPPVVRQIRDTSLTKEQTKAYTMMKDEMLAVLGSGEVVEAIHKANLTQKLFQIAAGAAISDKKEVVTLDASARLATIEEVISEAQAKTVIFCTYTGVIDKLEQDLKARNYSVAVVDGRITGNKRDKIFRAFQEGYDPKILICHPRTTAFGVELSAADTMIFNGPPLTGEFVYAQALERLSSLKQKASQVSIIQIAATREERLFFEGLDKGLSQSEVVNNLFSYLKKD